MGGQLICLFGSSKSVPVCPPDQGWSGAALGLLWASNRRITRHLYGCTDLRGNREEGGGADADLRIKTEPGESSAVNEVLIEKIQGEINNLEAPLMQPAKRAKTEENLHALLSNFESRAHDDSHESDLLLT